MTLSIMPTKLQKPQLPQAVVIKRERTQQLSEARINIVSAQAGSGKSTIVSYWLSQQKEPYIWYALDEWDNELEQFIAYLIEGFKAIDIAISDQMGQLLSARQSIGDEALIKAFTTLLHTIGHPYILVLDDYHAIQDKRIHQLMQTLIGHFPPVMHLCIISREDPPFSMAKLRSQRMLTALRMSDLRFTLEDTEAFFSNSIQKQLTSNQLEYLYGRTEGWIAGLQLTALSLQGVEDIDRFITDFSESHYYIMDYLLEEVLERHSVSIREFLLKSSIFEYFSPELCDDVMGLQQGEGKKCIEFLLKTNSFLITLNAMEKVPRIDSETGWFRYHHLFRELLRSRVNLLAEGELNKLYLRAGKWFESQGRHQEAIDNFLKGGHDELAAALIEVKWETMDLELRSSSWLEMAKRLPETIIDRCPVILVGIGWALLDRGEIEACEPWFEKGQKLYDSWQDDDSRTSILVNNFETFTQLPVTLMNAEAYIAAIKGDYNQLVEKTQALRNLSELHVNNKLWVIDTFVATINWGSGELDQAIYHMMQVKDGARGQINPLMQSSMVWVLAELYIQKGELTHAKLLLEKAIEEVEREGIVPILMATYYMYLGMIATFRGEIDQAYKYLETSKAYGHRFEFMDFRYKYYTLKARLHILEGSWDLAKTFILEGRKCDTKNPIPESFTIEDMDLSLNLKMESDINVLRHRIDEALTLLEPFSEDDPAYTSEMQWKLIFRYAPINHYASKLEPICKILLERAKTQKRWLHVVEYTLLLMRFTKSEAVKQVLHQSALQLADFERIKLPFMEYIESPSVSPKGHANKMLQEPLTARELEILELIEKGFSNQEIAGSLFIALSTVKSYNNSLFGKLEVRRRTEAIAKANTMGLL
jgi:LuxR family maltose regulon positive regulatory protein